MSNATFSDVAGQTVTVPRPPKDYVCVVDTNGTSVPVSKELLVDVDRAGERILRLLATAPTPH